MNNLHTLSEIQEDAWFPLFPVNITVWQYANSRVF